MRARRISCRVTEEEWQAIWDYCERTDHIDIAALVRKAVFAHVRRDKRRLGTKYHDTLCVD